MSATQHPTTDDLRQLEARIDARFQAVNMRFASVDGRLRGVDDRIEEIDGRWQTLSRRFDTQLDRVSHDVRRTVAFGLAGSTVATASLCLGTIALVI